MNETLKQDETEITSRVVKGDLEDAANVARGMGIEWGMEAARLEHEADEIETVDALLNKEAAAYSIETNIRALVALEEAAPQNESDTLRQLCRMALQQFEFQYGDQKRGWDVAFLMEQLRAATTTGNTVVDEVQQRMDAVVDAAVEWAQAEDDSLEECDKLSDCVESLLSYRSDVITQDTSALRGNR